MSFRSFLRDMFVFDWLFGKRCKDATPTNHTNNYTSYNCSCNWVCDHDFIPPRSSGYSQNNWDDELSESDDYDHELDDLDDFDDLDDDFGDLDDLDDLDDDF